jgi:hypothetical protein
MGRGNYGLTIMPAGAIGGNVKELSSDKGLRDALTSLGYKTEEMDDILEILCAKEAFWTETRNLDESAVAALGF